MKLYQKGFAPIIILVGVLLVVLAGGGIYYASKLKPSQSQKITPTSVPDIIVKNTDQNPAKTNAPFLQILDINKKEEISNNQAAYQEIFMRDGKGCQPGFFDPQTTKYRRLNPGDELYDKNYYSYVTEPASSLPFSIETIKTNSGYDIEVYGFGCASSVDFVLDVRKDQKRVALYTHVDTYYVNEKENFLFLNNYLQNKEGKLELKRRIISFDGSKKIIIPQTNCVSRFANWSENNLITYSDRNVDTSSFGGEQFQNYKTRICVWNTDGKLLHKLQGELTWYGASSDSLWASIGTLPKDPNIFYAYNDNDTVSPKKCSLYLQDLTDQSRYKTINLSPELLPDIEVMPQQLCLPGSNIEFDLSNTTFKDPFIRYRIKGKDWQTAGG